MTKKCIFIWGILLVSLLCYADLKNVDIHMYGGWAYGKTNENNYLFGNKDGSFEFSNFSLNVSSNPIRQLKITAQVEWLTGPEHLMGAEEVSVELDYVFAQWKFSDEFSLRIGRIKHPFGIFTEFYDVGTLRPFYTTPQAIYGPAGFISEAYNGIGFTGLFSLKGGWEIKYDLYGGQILLLDQIHGQLISHEDVHMEEDEHLAAEEEAEGDVSGKNVIGLRLTFNTPLSGLNFGFSFFTSKLELEEEEEEGEEHESTTHTVFGGHIEYISDFFQIRSEYGHNKSVDETKVNSAYLEAAYNLTEKWQITGRYDWVKVKSPLAEILEDVPSLSEHKEFAFGLNYWFTPGMVIKLSYHRVDGNLFTINPDMEDILENGGLEEKTSMVIFGVQFSF